MVKEMKEMSIYIHLCACDRFVDIVKNMMKIHLATIIERESNCNIIPSMEEFPFLYMEIKPRKIYGYDLKFTIPVKVNCQSILRINYGYFYHIIKYIYNEKWITQYMENKIYRMLHDFFYKNSFVAFSSTSIKKILVTYTPLKI
jgi:hypothetical protein